MPAAPTPRSLNMLSSVQPGDEVASYQASIRQAVVAAVTPEHVRDVVAGIIDRAKSGDPLALTHFFGYLAGGMNGNSSQARLFQSSNSESVEIAARIQRASQVKTISGGRELTDTDIDADD